MIVVVKSLNLLCCECHKYYHVWPADVVEFEPCQKKHDSQYCGCQSFLASTGDEKVCCCKYRQNFHRRGIVMPTMCSASASSGAFLESLGFTGNADRS